MRSLTSNLCGYLCIYNWSHVAPVPLPALGVSQIDAPQQQRQFLVAEHDLRFLAGGLRPAEASLLQALGTHPQSTAVPEQQFQTIALRVGEQEDMPAQWIAQQAIPRHAVKALEALAHVRGSGSQIDSRCPSPAEHAQTPSSTRTNCSRAPVSNPRPTSIPPPPRSPTANALPVAATGAGARPDPSTASNAFLPLGACRSRRLRYRPR